MFERVIEGRNEQTPSEQSLDQQNVQFRLDQRALHYSTKYAMFELRYLRVKLEVTLNQDLMKLNRNRKATQGVHLKQCNTNGNKTVSFTFGSNEQDFRRWQELFFGVKSIERVQPNLVVEENNEEDDDDSEMIAEMDEDFQSQNIQTVYDPKRVYQK